MIDPKHFGNVDSSAYQQLDLWFFDYQFEKLQTCLLQQTDEAGRLWSHADCFQILATYLLCGLGKLQKPLCARFPHL